MTKNEEDPPDPANGIELKGPKEIYSTDFLIRIEGLQVMHLSTTGKAEMDRLLKDLANSIIRKGLRQASTDEKGSFQIDDGQVKVALALVAKDMVNQSGKQNRKKTALESMAIGALLGAVSPLSDHHLYWAIGYLVVALICVGTLYIGHLE